jgi:putative transposase
LISWKGDFVFWGEEMVKGRGENLYPLADRLQKPAARVAMPRAPRLVAPGGTIHVVARCNNREFSIVTPEDYEVLLDHLREMIRVYEVVLYAYTLMANHIHLLLRAPDRDALGRPLRWFMTETARAFNKARGRKGHFWERRYRAILIEDDLYALTALRYLDRNPVRAGVVGDPAAYPWSSCAAYALGVSNPLVTLHASYLALSRQQAVRRRHYIGLLLPSQDPRLDAREPCWSAQQAVGSSAFLMRHLPSTARRKVISVPPQIQTLGR